MVVACILPAPNANTNSAVGVENLSKWETSVGLVNIVENLASMHIILETAYFIYETKNLENYNTY